MNYLPSQVCTGILLSGALVMLSAPAVSSDEAIDEVEVIGRRVNLVGDASSASEGLVSHVELEQRPLLRTGEIMETIPGMVATQHSGSGKANQYFLRGFNLDHGTDFATFVDKMPVNMRTHAHGQGYTDINFVIPEMVEEIEYHKGSYYSDVGDFSGTGAGEIRTIDHADANRVSLGLGKDGFQRALIAGQVDQQNSATFYGLELQGYDGPWDDIDEDVEKINLWLKQRWSSGADTFAVTLMAYENSWNSADQIPQRAVDQGIISDLGSIDTTVGGESSRYSLSGSWLRDMGNASLNASAYIIDYDMDLFSNFSYFTQAGGDQFEQVDDRQIGGWDVSYALDSALASMAMTNTFGSQSRYDKINEVALQNSQAREFTGYTRADAVDEWSTSLYWQNELHWTPQLRTIMGVRYDYFSFDVDPLEAGDPASLALNGGSTNDDIATASLSVIYAMNDMLELYGSVGSGFHSNDARGTTITVDPTDATSSVDAVDPLVASLGYEIGFRSFISDKLNASVALWHLDVDSELLFVGDEGGTEDTGESSTRNGIELTAYYYMNNILTFDLEYSYTDSQFDKPVDGSTDIPGALESVISAGVNADFGNGLFTNLRLRYFDDYPLDGGETAAASSLVNLRMGYRPNDTWSFTLDILNLFDSDDHDVEYYYESQLQNETVSVEDHHFHVFEPRTFRAYAEYRF